MCCEVFRDLKGILRVFTCSGVHDPRVGGRGSTRKVRRIYNLKDDVKVNVFVFTPFQEEIPVFIVVMTG